MCYSIHVKVTSEGGAAVNGSGSSNGRGAATSAERSYEVELELTAAGRHKWLAPYSSDAEAQVKGKLTHMRIH
jgi:hypothetical protein